MKKRLIKLGQLVIALGLCSSLAGCDDPHVYGSIGVSSYGGGYYGGGPRVGGSISIGGRIR